MSVRTSSAVAFAAALCAASPVLAANAPEAGGPGFEVGVRTGYAFPAGNLGAPPNLTDAKLGDYVGGQLPLWLDAGYRFNSDAYLGAYFQYGVGFVNDDRQALCRNANVECSAQGLRLGVMARYHLPPVWQVLPWVGLGVGYEWGSFSVDQSFLVSINSESSWSGFEFANLQAGADYHLSPRVALGPFVSVSLGQFRSTSTTTTTGTITETTERDLAKKSLHEWIMIGARISFAP